MLIVLLLEEVLKVLVDFLFLAKIGVDFTAITEVMDLVALVQVASQIFTPGIVSC